MKAPGHIPPRPADLSEIPVYLTEVQRDIFFAPLKPLFTGKLDGNHQCSECGAVLRSIQVIFLYRVENDSASIKKLYTFRRVDVTWWDIFVLFDSGILAFYENKKKSIIFRCSLCDVGAFFCSDMRTHLMNRHCPNLHLAPSGYVKVKISIKHFIQTYF